MGVLAFADYRKGLLAVAQITLAKRRDGVKVSRDPLPQKVGAEYQIDTPDVKYLADVKEAVAKP